MHTFQTKQETATNISTLISKGAILIDVRSPKDFKSNSIHDSFNFPLTSLNHNWKVLKSFERPIILISENGQSASKAIKLLSTYQVDCHHGGSWKNFI
jgi:phage shock protein E